jgi:hypothetical protein
VRRLLFKLFVLPIVAPLIAAVAIGWLLTPRRKAS